MVRGGMVDGVGVVVGGVVGGGVGGRIGGRVGALTDWNVHLNPFRLGLWVGPAWKTAMARFEDIFIEPGFVK